LPYFIETLELSSLTLGRTAPRIVGVYTPKLNEWGIWVDLEVSQGVSLTGGSEEREGREVSPAARTVHVV
ncbi:hypothetical protein TELCIR_06764, partial [Teladorsagia circumcincta]